MKLIERNSPHIRSGRSAEKCMWHVIIAICPALACAFYYFGLPAMRVTAVCAVSCVVCELLIAKFMLRSVSRASLVAALLTGLLLAMNLPSILPWWMAVFGSVVAIGIGKMAFGGLGCNIFNPALVGRVFLLISFPVAMTCWALPGSGFEADAATGPTILMRMKHGGVGDVDTVSLLLGNRGGSMGEVGALALILGFVYLLIVKVITWHIPVAIVCSVAIFDLLLGVPVGIDLLSGGLLLGAIFMATDYVTSPMWRGGMLLYGVMIGIITVIIRRWGAYPEGMSFAILIMNGCTPLINRYMRPRRFGCGVGKEVTA